MANEDSNEYVTQQIDLALEAAKGAGMALPWHVAVIGANGALYYLRYDPAPDGSLDADILLEYVPGDDRFSAPVNIMVVDSRGEAMKTDLQPFSKN